MINTMIVTAAGLGMVKWHCIFQTNAFCFGENFTYVPWVADDTDNDFIHMCIHIIFLMLILLIAIYSWYCYCSCLILNLQTPSYIKEHYMYLHHQCTCVLHFTETELSPTMTTAVTTSSSNIPLCPGSFDTITAIQLSSVNAKPSKSLSQSLNSNSKQGTYVLLKHIMW